MAIGFAIPAPSFANPFMQVGVGALRGAAIGAIAGGAASAIGGGSFGAGALQGAIGGAQGGALSGFMTSQQFQNWKTGNGFRSDATVQAEQRQLAKLQIMLDEAYVEGGTEGIFKTVGSVQDNGTRISGWVEVPGGGVGTKYFKMSFVVRIKEQLNLNGNTSYYLQRGINITSNLKIFGRSVFNKTFPYTPWLKLYSSPIAPDFYNAVYYNNLSKEMDYTL